MLSRSTVMRWVARCKAEVDPVFQFTKAGQSKANPSDEPSAVATVEATTSDEPTKRHKQEVLLEQCLEKKANKSEA